MTEVEAKQVAEQEQDIDEKKVWHALVPHKDRLMLLISFLRARLSESIIIISASANTSEFLCILMNNFELKSAFVTGHQDAESRRKAIERFDKGQVQILCATPTVLKCSEITKKATWAIQWDLPLGNEEEMRLINHLNVEKFLILLDPSHSEYIDRLGDVKVAAHTELPFDPKKLPKIENQVLSLFQLVLLNPEIQLNFHELGK